MGNVQERMGMELREKVTEKFVSEREGAAHRQDDKTVDLLLWQNHQIQHW